MKPREWRIKNHKYEYFYGSLYASELEKLDLSAWEIVQVIEKSAFDKIMNMIIQFDDGSEMTVREYSERASK